MRKRISSIFYIFPLCFKFLAEKSENSEGFKKSEKSRNFERKNLDTSKKAEISKMYEQIWNSENLKKSWTFSKKSENIEISKSEKISKFLKTNLKIVNQFVFPKIEVSNFFHFSSNIFFNILRKIYFEHSFMSKSHFCDFATFQPHSTTNDHHMTPKWPSNYPQMCLNEISDTFKKCLEIFYTICWHFVFHFLLRFFQLFWDSDFDFGSRFSDLGFALRFSDFLQIFRFRKVFSGYFLQFSIFFYGNWTEGSAIICYIFCNFIFPDFFRWYIPLLLFNKIVMHTHTHT